MLYLSVGGFGYLPADDENGLLAEIDFPTQKARALFVYLGLTQGQRHSRRALSALFWPDADEKGAANNLRQTVHRIRTMLFEAGVDPAIVDTSAQHVALAASPDLVIDALRVDQVLRECRTHKHRSLERCTICARRLAQVAERITEAPLAGLTLTDSPEFELWLTAQRTQIVDSSSQVLQTLAKFHIAGAEAVTALHYVRQWLALEPWQEEAHALAMQLLAAQGKRTAALHQFQQCRQLLQDELGVEPDADLQRLHDRIAASGIPPLAAPQLHHAPFAATPLFGRQAEWHTLEALLNDPANRLVTLQGMGGVGKTALALAAGHAMARLFPDGAWYVSLDALGETQFQAELARSLGIALGDGQPLENQILQFLSRRNLLILLDGFEHLVQIASFLARLLQRCPGLTLLVTSRARLDLHVERVLPLDSLTVPETLALRRDDADDSLTHFVHAAQRLAPHFALTPENNSDVLEICHLLGGLPLAVELTAAQSATYSCQQLARELRFSLDLAAANWLDVSPRQRSLRASFDASWRHLPPDLQQVLSRLTVFEGTFAADAARAIVQAMVDDRCSVSRMEAILHRLVDISLLCYAANGRYSLHAAVRAFASERLAEHDPRLPHRIELTRTAHLRYFAGWLHARHPSYAGPLQQQYLAQIDLETSNLWAAWAWAVTNGDWTAIDALAPPLHAFCTIRGRAAACARLLDLAIDALQAHAPPDAELVTAAGQLYCQVLARLSVLCGLTANHLAQSQLAQTHADTAAHFLRQLDGEARAQRDLIEAGYWHLQCLLALNESHWPMMAAAAQTGLTKLPAGTDDRLRGLLLNYAGVAAQGQGDHQLAISSMRTGVDLLAGDRGDHWEAARQRANLAQSVVLLEGQDREAGRLWHEGYGYMLKVGDLVSAAYMLNNLAYLEVMVYNNPQAATDLCQQALAHLRHAGLPGREALILCSLGEIALIAGDLQAARDHLAASLRIAVEFSLTGEVITTGAWLAMALLQLGQQTTLAAQYLGTALSAPLMDANTRQRLKEHLAGLPRRPACEEIAEATGQPEPFDWNRAATQLAEVAATEAAPVHG